MKNSSVKIEGLTRIQANCLAIACEEGRLAEFLNERLTDIGVETSEILEDDIAYVNYDDSNFDVDHIATFN